MKKGFLENKESPLLQELQPPQLPAGFRDCPDFPSWGLWSRDCPDFLSWGLWSRWCSGSAWVSWWSAHSLPCL